MFTKKDIRLLNEQYFKILKTTDHFYEIQSNNTKHCWILRKSPGIERFPVIVYHKHTLKTAYYHNHANAMTVEHAIKLIKGHDDYVLHPETYTYARAERRRLLAQQ